MYKLNKINSYNGSKIINLIIKRNYSITKRNIELALKSQNNNGNVKRDQDYKDKMKKAPISQPQQQILSSLQFSLDEKDDDYDKPLEISKDKRVISTDDVISDPSSLEYLFRLDSEEDIKQHELNSKDKTSIEMAEEYIYRLLIDEKKRDAAEEEFLFQQITQLPEWNDYNDNVLRELKRLELEEIYNPQVDNDRLTSHYERERIKRVNEIRKIHFIPVRDAIYRRYKQLDKELDLIIEKKILVTMKNTGLSREQLKEHPNFAYLFDEDFDSKNELFSDKDELDYILESINGPFESIPPIMKSIMQSTKQNFEKEMELENKKLYLEASSSSLDQQFEQELVNINSNNNNNNKQYQHININNNNNNNNNNNDDNQQPQQQKISFSDIINDKSYKLQQQKQQQQHKHSGEEEFDLKSILNNMSKKV